MSVSSINSLTATGQPVDVQQRATEEQREVARQFEAIFLRQLLSGLQKTSGHGGEGTGSQMYRSMMVGAVADSAAEAGGIGLSEVILRSMLPKMNPAPASELSPAEAPAVMGTERSKQEDSVDTPVADRAENATEVESGALR